MNKIVLAFSVLFFATTLVAQDALLTCDKYPELKYYGLVGDISFRAYTQIKGSAFLSDEWIDGTLILDNGLVLKDLKLKFDQYTQKVLVYHERLHYIVSIENKTLPEFRLSHGKETSRFIRFPKDDFTINLQIATDFLYLEQLAAGDISFYRLSCKTKIPLVPAESPLLDQFIPKTEYYLKEKNEIDHINLGKSVLKKRYKTHKSEIMHFIRKEHLHVKRPLDFSRVIDYVNSLN